MKKIKNKEAYIVVAIYLFSTLLFILKSFLSTEISLADEGHYIATALRLYHGDALLVDDWSAEQLNGFLLFPFIHIYMYIFGKTDGIILYFRLLYIIFKLIISIWAMLRLKKNNSFGIYGYLGVGFFWIFTPYNIDTLSYNTIPLAVMFILDIIILCESDSKKEYIFSGILWALAILAQPFLMFTYLFMLVWVVIYNCFKKGKGIDGVVNWKNFLALSGGAIIVAIVFTVFIFSRANWNEIMENIIFIFSEPDHNVVESGTFVSLWKNLKLSIDSIVKDYPVVTWLNVVYLFLTVMYKLYHKFMPVKYDSWWAMGAVVCLTISCIDILISKPMFIENIIYIPFLWLAFGEIVLLKFKMKNIFVICMTILYTIAVGVGTNTGILTTSTTICVLATITVILLQEFEQNLPGEYSPGIKLNKIANLACILFLLICTFVMRIVIAWTDTISFESIGQYSWYLERGPLKGTYAKESVYVDYNMILNDLDLVEVKKDDILFCGTSTPMAYIYLDVEFGTMGTPFFSLDYERLDKYYELHPKKFPTIVYYKNFTEEDEESGFIKKIQNYEINTINERMIAKKK